MGDSGRVWESTGETRCTAWVSMNSDVMSSTSTTMIIDLAFFTDALHHKTFASEGDICCIISAKLQ
jgi:hypothetical protein